MKGAIFEYFYNYNYYIKHSGIQRMTPMEALKGIFEQKEDNGVKFKENLDIMDNKNKKLLDSYKMGCDT